MVWSQIRLATIITVQCHQVQNLYKDLLWLKIIYLPEEKLYLD